MNASGLNHIKGAAFLKDPCFFLNCQPSLPKCPPLPFCLPPSVNGTFLLFCVPSSSSFPWQMHSKSQTSFLNPSVSMCLSFSFSPLNLWHDFSCLQKTVLNPTLYRVKLLLSLQSPLSIPALFQHRSVTGVNKGGTACYNCYNKNCYVMKKTRSNNNIACVAKT